MPVSSGYTSSPIVIESMAKCFKCSEPRAQYTWDIPALKKITLCRDCDITLNDMALMYLDNAELDVVEIMESYASSDD